MRCECLTRTVDACSLSKKECCVVVLVGWSRLQQRPQEVVAQASSTIAAHCKPRTDHFSLHASEPQTTFQQHPQDIVRTLAEHMAKLPNLEEVLRRRHALAQVDDHQEDGFLELNADGSVSLCVHTHMHWPLLA